MKKIIFILILYKSFFFSDNLKCQWVWQNPLPQGNNLTSVKFINDNYGWAVGYKGSIIKTLDGGNNWIVQYSECDSVIKDVYFVDSLTGYACSNTSMVLKTSNGGLNWILQTINSNACSFYKIYFSNANTGYVAGYDYGVGRGIILKTTNGGVNWLAYFTEPYTNTDNYVYDFQIFNENITFAAVGDINLYKTVNSGVNWQQIQAGWGLMYLFFADTLNGCTSGGYGYGSSLYGNIKKTTNGGLNFTTILNCIDTVFTSLYFTNSQTGYVSGYKGGIRKTTDLGDNWVTLNSGTSVNLNSIIFRNPDTGITVGDYGLILKTISGGNNWNTLTKGKRTNLSGICFINENTGFIGGLSVILKSTNGGLNWIPKLDTNIVNVVYLKFFNENTGVALSNSAYSNGLSHFLYTTNAGENWSVKLILNCITNPDTSLSSLSMINQNTGYACGYKTFQIPGHGYSYSGIYIKTTNGGQNWIGTELGSEVFQKIIFFDENSGFLFGRNLKILKTTNGGINWIVMTFNHPGQYFGDAYFLNQNTGWLSYFTNNSRSYLFKTTNGGDNWQFLDSINNALFYSLCADNNGNCWAVGGKYAARSSSVIYSSSNGGINWIFQRSPTDYQLNNVSFVNNNTGWIVGSNGTILKTTSGIISGVNFETNTYTKNYFLFQNYPNPFNPVTIIKYQISTTQSVKLKIFDIIGREIRTLVNESQSPGTYEMIFDGSGLASGVYFYQLRAGNFEETKKMLMIK